MTNLKVAQKKNSELHSSFYVASKAYQHISERDSHTFAYSKILQLDKSSF